MTFRVSIVIPTYNNAQYLKTAIDSVLAQSYGNIELIVLDDGSTDGTTEILREYGTAFKWNSHANIGQSATLNKGWASATGEIFSYLSADDALLPRAVQDAVDFLNGNDSCILTYCDYDLINEYSQKIRTVQTPEFDYWDMVVRLICQPGPGVFFRRSVFEKIGGWDERLRQIPDLDYWIRLGIHGPFKHIPSVGALYRVHEESQTFAKADYRGAQEPVEVIKRFYAQQNGMPDRIRGDSKRSLSNAYLMSARLHIRSNRSLPGARNIFYAFRLHPLGMVEPRTIKLLINALLSRSFYKLWYRIGRKT
ncbi:glycosyltransferase [Saccharibacillus sp. CPCC 101409]|uniref:glycosyltransferase n=1 Tax=Saccharibacillus sp. CPCC 101409 TaxID=3058041 RepID=UPI00267416F7|nr:glycosyltransferase [Saccharibacillus sp. CPCC 101409]MDO3412027.1 glycosyltransferase [Saccharibacillus sp. CPCC 101409]